MFSSVRLFVRTENLARKMMGAEVSFSKAKAIGTLRRKYMGFEGGQIFLT